MKQVKFNYTFFKGVCVIVLVFGLLFAAPSAIKLYKDNFVYTKKNHGDFIHDRHES